MAPIKFLGKGGVALKFSTYVCSHRDGHSGEKRYVFQLLTGPPAPPPKPAAPLAEHGKTTPYEATAHKQKLDCAMQLARTVALDFNNALTSILGHTSLVLSKIGWDHVCRPLMEVEPGRAGRRTAHQLAFGGTRRRARVGKLKLRAAPRRDSCQKGKPSTLAWSFTWRTSFMR